jgi:ABC-type amino acid transport system permease subunit
LNGRAYIKPPLFQVAFNPRSSFSGLALPTLRSKLPAIRSLCVLYVELIRGVPLISLLFMASVMFPLFMPDGVNIDKLLRAQIAFAKTSVIDPAWQPFSVEFYVFVALIYFVFCFAMSRYSRGLEAQARPG